MYIVTIHFGATIQRTIAAREVAATSSRRIVRSVGKSGHSAAAKQAAPTANDQVASIKPDFPERIAQNHAAAIASDKKTTEVTRQAAN